MKNAITLTDLPRLAELLYEAAQKNHALLLAPIACEVLYKTMGNPLPEPAAPVSNDTIARSKRILALVDDYHDQPSQQTRMTLRKALMDEFDRAALASAPATIPASGSGAAHPDTARLDFVLDNQRFICVIPGTPHGYQLMEQDEDEDYQTISGEGIAYPTMREAIDVAMDFVAAAKESA